MAKVKDGPMPFMDFSFRDGGDRSRMDQGFLLFVSFTVNVLALEPARGKVRMRQGTGSQLSDIRRSYETIASGLA